jgi:hypothetical protein
MNITPEVGMLVFVRYKDWDYEDADPRNGRVVEYEAKLLTWTRKLAIVEKLENQIHVAVSWAHMFVKLQRPQLTAAPNGILERT